MRSQAREAGFNGPVMNSFPMAHLIFTPMENSIPATTIAKTPEEYRANDPKGKAFLRAADYQPPHKQPDEEYPLWLTTGRLVYHFHTRTKTGRSKELHEAAPDCFVQISQQDAQQYGITEGDLIEVISRRGQVVEKIRVGEIEPGAVFIPFHYGYWDRSDYLALRMN